MDGVQNSINRPLRVILGKWAININRLIDRFIIVCCLKKNLNAQASLSQGGKNSKRSVGRIMGCKDKTPSWHLNEFSDAVVTLGQQSRYCLSHIN